MVEDALELLAGYVERFWDSVHPTLEEYGIEGRRGACEALVRIGEFLGPLRRMPLIDHPRLGGFSGGDFERFATEGAAADGYGQFRAAIADTPVEAVAEQRDRLERMRAAILRADAVISERAAEVGQTGNNFTATYDAIDSIRHAMQPFVAQSATPATDDGPAPDSPNNSAGSFVAIPGRIGSREEVARAIDSIIDYYARAEPSSPIPIALVRIKGWIATRVVNCWRGSRACARSCPRSWAF